MRIEGRILQKDLDPGHRGQFGPQGLNHLIGAQPPLVRAAFKRMKQTAGIAR